MSRSTTGLIIGHARARPAHSARACDPAGFQVKENENQTGHPRARGLLNFSGMDPYLRDFPVHHVARRVSVRAGQ